MAISGVLLNGRATTAALVVLVLLAVLSPWPLGSVDPRVVWAVTVVTLASSLLVLLCQQENVAREPAFVAVTCLPALALLQLVPLPAFLHALLAPGSAAVWHPAEPAAAAVLGFGPRPLSIDPGATRRFLSFVLGLATLALLAAPALRRRRTAVRVAFVVSAAALAVGLFGVVARLLFGSRLYGSITVPTIAPFGPFVSKNHFAGFVEMGALLALGLAASLAQEAGKGRGALGWTLSSRAGRVVAAGGAAATMSLAVLISQSRGGAVSLAAGLLAFAAYGALDHPGRRPRRVVVALVTVAMVAAAGFAVLPEEARGRVLSLAGVTTEGSGAFRLGVWRDTLRLAGSSPLFGLGLGAFADALAPFKSGAADLRVEHAENDYLEMLAEGGLLGLALALTSVLLAARSAARGIRGKTAGFERGLLLGAAAGATSLLVHGLFDFNLRITSNAILFALLFAWVLSPAHDPGPADSPGQRRPSSRFSRALMGGLVLALGATFFGPLGSPTASRLEALREARVNPTPLHLASAEATLVAHLRRRPADAEAWLHLGWVRAARGHYKEGAALARYATRLDPERRALTAGAEALAVTAGR
jgi:O-antigen ligase